MGSGFLNFLFGEGFGQSQRPVDEALIQLEILFDDVHSACTVPPAAAFADVVVDHLALAAQFVQREGVMPILPFPPRLDPVDLFAESWLRVLIKFPPPVVRLWVKSFECFFLCAAAFHGVAFRSRVNSLLIVDRIKATISFGQKPSSTAALGRRRDLLLDRSVRRSSQAV